MTAAVRRAAVYFTADTTATTTNVRASAPVMIRFLVLGPPLERNRTGHPARRVPRGQEATIS
ncbi:hypothetical protein GCM10010359_01750 [Streptomyces morookaense]|nr:hypothetical protein GCM10010359_01750 [Streptomyces morookaense]